MRANPRAEEVAAEAAAVGVEAAGLQADAEVLAGEGVGAGAAHLEAAEDSVAVAEGAEDGEGLVVVEAEDSPEAGAEVERGCFPLCPVEKKEKKKKG